MKLLKQYWSIYNSKNHPTTPFFKGGFFFPFAFLLLVLHSLPVFSAFTHPPFWTDSQQISLGQGFSSEVDTCFSGDKIYVAWSDDRTGNKEIFFRYSQDAGQTWSREERLTDTSGESSQPAIACDSRNLYMVWQEKTQTLENSRGSAPRDDVSRIYYKRFDGESWSDDILLSDGGGTYCSQPDIASTTIFPGSYLYVVWESTELLNGSPVTTVYLVRSANGGQSFSAPKPVTEGIWSTKEPAVWCGARDAYIAWSDNREGAWNIFFRRCGEALMGPEVKLSPLPDCSSPAISGAEPRIYIAWQCVVKDAVYADVYVSQSADYGASWSDAEKLTEGEAEAVFPKITVSDKARVFWQDGRNGEWQIFFLTLDKNPPFDAQPLMDIDKPSILPDVTSTYGQVHLFWTRLESGSKAGIMYMRRDTLSPERPGTPYHFDLTAATGYDDDKQITFLWEASEPAGSVKYNVYASSDNKDFALVGNTRDASYNLQGEGGKVYQVYIEAVDEVGNVSIPSGISPKVICDPDPPEVMIHSPHSGSTIRGAVPIIISIEDINLLECNVEYGAGAVPSVWNHLAGPFHKDIERERIMTWEVSGLNGIYTLRVSATDKADNESEAGVVINIDSLPPVTVSSGEVAQLTPPDAIWTYGAPAWSPNGDKIAFHSDEGGAEDVWVMSQDGNNRSRLTRDTAIDRNPRWSPAGDMIVFQSSDAGTIHESPQWKIWVVWVDGKGNKQITFGEGSDMNPSWSPDGSSIAFDSDRDGDSDIWLITNVSKVLTGAELPQLIKLTDNDWEDKNPEWSPDGSKIVFQSNGKGNYDLFEIGIDGANISSIIATPADEIEPDWSPDGKWILFSAKSDHYEIRAISWPERAEQVKLSTSDKDAHNAQWSPRMDSIIYESGDSLYSAMLVYPVKNLEAGISWPRGGEVLTGKVEVRGVACGSDFRKYSLQYFDPETSSFRLIGGESTAQVPETGFLGTWQTEELEGEYLLRLVVVGKDGRETEDSVRVLISNRLPFIIIDEPQNGLITNKPVINVSGRTERQAILTLNDNEVRLNSDGNFSQKVQLSEGSNKIIIKARSPSTQSKEYVVERTIILDTKSPEIVIESPADFQVVHVPYITVKGRVNEKAEVSILSTRAWTDENGNFQRKISIKEGMNPISIIASDKLGHYRSVVRRIIYQKRSEITSDVNPPAITDVFPDNRAIVTGRTLRITATLIDDTGLDPFSIAFLFDNEEIDREDYDLDIGMLDETEVVGVDQYPIIHFTYRPEPSISEGEHSFKLQVKDTFDNITESAFTFSIDTIPPEVMVSAFLTEKADKIRVVAVANKPLAGIGSASVISEDQIGYSILFAQKEGYYEAFLNISPSQKDFIIDFSGITYLGSGVNAHGYMAWNTGRSGETVNLGSEHAPRFVSDPIGKGTGKLTLVLRSQDGLDADMLTIYRNDAEYRRLQLSGLIYVLSASEELGELQGVLNLPISSAPAMGPKNIVMFHWNEDLKQWRPLDRIGLSDVLVSSRIAELGTYALFADFDPPVISDVSPKDAGEVPLDRFFVEANISDKGSGISQIRLMVDGKQSDYDYDPLSGHLTYFPSELEWGLHKMEITAVDRAGNIAKFSGEFVTEEIFQFITVRAYPNPATDNVNIEFKLTRFADVTLRIYTITGELIYDSKKENVAQGQLTWKCRNSAGNKVASGVYIYLIEAKIYETMIHRHGRIAIVR